MRNDRDRGVHRGVARHRRRWGGPRNRPDDRGSSTAEFAAALPGVILLLLIGLAMVGAFAAKVRLVDAAGVSARAVARGEPLPATGHGTALGSVTISVRRDGDLVHVNVRRVVRIGPLPAITLNEEAVAVAEPTGTAP